MQEINCIVQRRLMSRRVPPIERSLACFVQALEGLAIVVELHTDAIVRGRLESADEGMNLVLTSATFQPLQGSQQSMDFLFVKGANIRSVLTCSDLVVAQESFLTCLSER